MKAKALFVLQPIITKFPVLPTQTAAHCRFFDYTILRNAFLYNCEDGKRRPLFLKLLFRVSLVLLFGRPGAAAAHYVRSVGANNHSPLQSRTSFRLAPPRRRAFRSNGRPALATALVGLPLLGGQRDSEPHNTVGHNRFNPWRTPVRNILTNNNNPLRIIILPR